MYPHHRGSVCFLVLLLLSLAAAGAQQQQQAPRAAPSSKFFSQADEFLKAQGLNLWSEVLRIAGVERDWFAAPARYAALIPTDAAVRLFLSSMGLDMSGLAARPQLAKQLVAHHLVLALPSDVRQQLVQGKLTAVQTSAGGDYAVLRVAVVKNNMQQQQQLQVTDAQGQTATSVKIIKPDGNKVAVIIDKVLQSGYYYTSFASLCKHRAAQAGAMCEALTKSGVLKDPSSPAFPNTVFIPGPRAFKQATIQLASSSGSGSGSLSQSQLTDLVKYHVVPGLHAFPGGFTAGTPYNTLLPGASLKIEYSGDPARVAAAASSSNETLVAYVVPADNQRVPVVVYNVFVGQAVAQGIPAVLLPPGFKGTASGKTSSPPAGVDGKGQQSIADEKGRAAASPTGHHRRLLGAGIDTFTAVNLPFNAAESEIRGKTRSMFKEADREWA